MKIGDVVTRFYGRGVYAFGTLIASALVGHIGRGARVHPSVRYWQPSGIHLGSRCEIRHGVSLDARSPVDTALFVGDCVRIKELVSIAAYGGSVRLCDHVLIGRCATVFGHGGVQIGPHSMIGPNVHIISTNHVCVLSGVPFQAQGFTREPVTIENNVWIGSQATVLPGTVIRSNVVVAAGSVVRDELHSGWIYAGSPARQVARLSEELPVQTAVFHRDWGLL